MAPGRTMSRHVDGRLTIAALLVDHAQEMQGVGVGRVSMQYLTIGPRRGVQPAGLMIGHGLGQQRRVGSHEGMLMDAGET